MGGIERTERPGLARRVLGGNGHLAVYVGWPLAGGLGMAMVLAACAGGLALLHSRDLGVAGRWLAWTFFIVWGAVTVLVFAYAAWGWGGPRRIEKLRQTVIEELVEVPTQQEKKPPIVIHGKGVPALLGSGLNVDVEGIEPAVDPEIEELYRFIVGVWPGGSVSREACRELGFGRATWERLVGGQRGKEGMESGRGLLDRAGCVRSTSSGWEICATLEEALGINRALRAYAEGKAEMVRIGGRA